MDRTFTRQITPPTLCGIILFAALAFFMLWAKAALIGMLFMLSVVLMIERVLNTQYKFTQNEQVPVLIIKNGRFARTQIIPLNEIIDYKRMKVSFGLSHYLLLEYGMNKVIGVQPSNVDDFIQELNKRQKGIEA